MARQFRLEQIQKDGPPIPVGVLSGDEVTVGREPPCHLVVPHTSISRQHGAFASIEGHWVYKDLGSTNGSWVNGAQVKPGQWKFIRQDDVLQLANVIIQVRVSDGPQPDLSPSLLIFNEGSYQQEVVFSRSGMTFSFGGKAGGLAIQGDSEQGPSLVIDVRGTELHASPGSRLVTSYLNEKDIFEPVRIRDGDELSIGQYVILVSDPIQHRQRLQGLRENAAKTTPAASMSPAVTTGAPLAPETPAADETSHVMSFPGPVAKPFQKFTPGPLTSELSEPPPRKVTGTRTKFGSREYEDDDQFAATMQMSKEELDAQLFGHDRHPSQRFHDESAVAGLLALLEDRLVRWTLVGFGVAAIFAVVFVFLK